jgi:hypothetical protein
LLHPFARPTILRELQAYRAFARLGVRTPRLVYGGARKWQGQWQALLVTEALQDFIGPGQWYANGGAAALKESVLCRLASTLVRLRRAGWQHGCCYPNHVFVKVGENESDAPQAEIALLDLEKSRRHLSARAASAHDLGQLSRHRGDMPEADLLLFQRVCQRRLADPPETPES